MLRIIRNLLIVLCFSCLVASLKAQKRNAYYLYTGVNHSLLYCKNSSDEYCSGINSGFGYSIGINRLKLLNRKLRFKYGLSMQYTSGAIADYSSIRCFPSIFSENIELSHSYGPVNISRYYIRIPVHLEYSPKNKYAFCLGLDFLLGASNRSSWDQYRDYYIKNTDPNDPDLLIPVEMGYNFLLRNSDFHGSSSDIVYSIGIKRKYLTKSNKILFFGIHHTGTLLFKDTFRNAFNRAFEISFEYMIGKNETDNFSPPPINKYSKKIIRRTID